MRTLTPKASEIQGEWYVVDAADQVLGRLATKVASVLRGKHKPQYSPHLAMGDHVVIINADKVKLTGAKLLQKTYRVIKSSRKNTSLSADIRAASRPSPTAA